MKTFINLIAFLLVVLLVQTSFAQTQGTSTMNGTAHDFTNVAYTWNTTGELCVVCHTPHNSDLTVADAPLWNHETSTVTDYNLYSSATFDSEGGLDIGQPDGSSKLCLSCHDGTVGLENFGGVGTNINLMTGNRRIGDDGEAASPGSAGLSNDHPISFTWNAADAGLWATSDASGITGGTTIDADMLFSGKMQCASCHDVHNSNNVPGLLVKDNTGSGLCLTCHKK